MTRTANQREVPVANPRGLWLDARDNVAVVLQDVGPGPVHIIGDSHVPSIEAMERVASGHKIALRPIAVDEAVVKYGVPIGFATAAIAAGAWVHTHNCRSRLDERSHTLDPHTGAAMDTLYE